MQSHSKVSHCKNYLTHYNFLPPDLSLNGLRPELVPNTRAGHI